ncbi:MAG: diheme cytochrome c [Deltaproteobacteria bacterium]|nr:MAG: diheme cytochrome c [Deltaproteobacteria bacterium]
MYTKQKWVVFLAAVLLLTSATFDAALAENGHKERRRYQKRHRNSAEHNAKSHLTPVNNSTYKETCGACHFTYQPELLPSASWGKILDRLDDHFGEEIDLDQEPKKIIAEYLKANGAESSSAKLAVKNMRSLKGQTPMRITDVPYIGHKHEDDDIPADAFQRKSVGSMSNCIACHTTAERGIYDDAYVEIPK